MLRHVTHNYIINFVEGLFPLASEAHRGYTSLHKYVITITSKTIKLSQTKIRCKYKIEQKYIKQDIDF